MATPASDAEFTELLSALRQDADLAVWNIAFLKSFVDNSTLSQKIGDSYSGYTAEIAFVAVRNALVLYCSRAWDTASDSVSLPRMAKHLSTAMSMSEEASPKREKSHINDNKGNVKPISLDSYLSFERQYLLIENPALHQNIRIIRTEFLSHRVFFSNDRKKIISSGREFDPPALSAIIDISEKTVNLVGQLGKLWDNKANLYPQRIDRITRYCLEFWHLLPTLREVENL